MLLLFRNCYTICQIIYFASLFLPFHCLSEYERLQLRDEARNMFIFAYDSYLAHAYPADELMPLSCKGRFRDVDSPGRGDVDDAMGNFSLTLIDSLDTLVILGNYSEFERAVDLVIHEVSFDSDIVVSVFETNIRVLGGLLSAHVLAQYLQEKHNRMKWYHGQLLDMAKDVGYRLLPAFDTPTGIPHPRINLKHGLNSPKIGSLKETCTSCAGTMILEFAALSRLTDNPLFEEKARKAMDYLWHQRHRQSDLVGNIINIQTGDWIRKESGVGAGIDSYYEYCLKAYILLGDESYLHRFNRHYAGVMKYVSQGPFLIDVHMHRPHNQAKNFMDSLLAFWPGLQVLKGDLKPAIETHEILYQITQKHTFLPEAFTVDLNVHWAHHPLRPEFIESTYFLYQATNDPHYLEVGKDVLVSLQNYTRVPCGYAAVNDVRTKKKEDRMDSFFLAETVKYLYLLFATKSDIELNLDEYVFTTEAHLLPLSLSYINNSNKTSGSKFPKNKSHMLLNTDYHCPSTSELTKTNNAYVSIDKFSYYRSLRESVQNSHSKSKPNRFSSKRLRVSRLRASDFSATKPEHIELLKQIGISVLVLDDGRIQLIHNSAAAISQEDAEEGAFFMQEMISLSKEKLEEGPQLRTVTFTLPGHSNKVTLLAGPAHFGSEFTSTDDVVVSQVVKMKPIDGCSVPDNAHQLSGRIAIAQRGNCMFVEKARNAEKYGATGLIVFDNSPNSSSNNMHLFAMSGDGSTDVTIPCVFLFTNEYETLDYALRRYSQLKVVLGLYSDDDTLEEKLTKHKQFFEPLITDDQASESNDYLFNLANLLNIFNSNKLNFDLLSSLKLKNVDEEKIDLILKKVFDSKKQEVKTTKYKINEKVIMNRSCANPSTSVKHLMNHFDLLRATCPVKT